jgi:hypothetical protein
MANIGEIAKVKPRQKQHRYDEKPNWKDVIVRITRILCEGDCPIVVEYLEGCEWKHCHWTWNEDELEIISEGACCKDYIKATKYNEYTRRRCCCICKWFN